MEICETEIYVVCAIYSNERFDFKILWLNSCILSEKMLRLTKTDTVRGDWRYLHDEELDIHKLTRTSLENIFFSSLELYIDLGFSFFQGK